MESTVLSKLLKLCVWALSGVLEFAANEVVCTRFAIPVNIPSQYSECIHRSCVASSR